MNLSLDRREDGLEGNPGVMTVWIRYTDSTLDDLLGDLEAVAPTESRCFPRVVDDDIADVFIDVTSELEGVAVVEKLKRRFAQASGLEIVRAQFLPREPR